MAEDAPRLPSTATHRRGAPWSRERIANMLVPRRDALVAQLPRELATARGLTRDQAELVIDEAIDFMVTEYALPIRVDEELERAFWATASYRVRRVHEGRGATIRAGWKRVDIDDVEIADGADPAQEAVADDERGTVREFAATLTPFEQTVLACKYGGQRELGRKLTARRLGITPARVRKAERSIARKLERFAAIVSAGTLCSHRDPALRALAEARATREQAEIAHAHLAHCPACRVAYTAHLRAIQTGELQRRIGALLPLPAAAEARQYRSGLWDSVIDWLSRPFAGDAANTASQAAAAARGVGTAAAAKIAVLCIGGAAAVGGCAWCVSELSPSPPRPRHQVSHGTPSVDHHVDKFEPRRASVPVVVPTPTATPRRRAPTRRAPRRTPATTPAPTSTPVTTTSHEQSTAISPAPPRSAPAGASEFTPGPASAPPPAPAAPAPGGGPEFP